VAGQDGDRHHLLPLGGHHRQRRRGAAQRDQRVQVRVVAGQPDHRRDQPGQPLPVGIGGAVVDLPGERGQHRRPLKGACFMELASFRARDP